ncbi:MAG TPA: DUF748 domain-containing protein, partial [Chitinophagaceae bacterium]|nr:DUF748 domain-containing protein [Chitinophagaceae bacterium]
MESETQPIKKKSRSRRIFIWIVGVFLAIVGSGAFYLYNNYSRLLSNALLNAFDSSLVSDVYELKFDKLGVNLVTGNIQVFNVELKPREKPLISYPYINSSLELRTKKILLSNVDIPTLLKTQRLILDRIEIIEPEIEVKLAGKRSIMFPFSDTSAVVDNKTKKQPIKSYTLKEFALVNASFHSLNTEKQREATVTNLSIDMKGLNINQLTRKDLLTNKELQLSIGEITWRLHKDAIRSISIKDYNLKLDSLVLENHPDTSIFNFANFSTGLKELDVQTGDSLFHLTLNSFKLSYRDSAIVLKGASFKPNMSDAAMQRRFVWRAPVFAGTVGTIKLVGLNFDSLIYSNKILMDELEIDKASVSIFTDQTKAVNPNKFPGYPGQQIGGMKLPMMIRHIRGTNLTLVNKERRPTGEMAQVHIQRMSLHGQNITTFPSSDPLTVNADAYIENKAHVTLGLGFSYNKPQYTIRARVKPFNLPDLNPLIKAYTPGSIQKGALDDLELDAVATRTGSSGSMKFLYNSLQLDVELKNQAKWKNDVLSTVGNAVLSSSNPPSPNKPP